MGLVITEDRGAVRHIVLNRPEKRNALGGDLLTELGAAVEDAAYDDAVRVVVLRGEGPMFSSGMDVGDLKELSDDPSELRRFRTPILQIWNLLEEMLKPTICQIHGAALGGAFELATRVRHADDGRGRAGRDHGGARRACCPTSAAARDCRRSSAWATRRS